MGRLLPFAWIQGLSRFWVASTWAPSCPQRGPHTGGVRGQMGWSATGPESADKTIWVPSAGAAGDHPPFLSLSKPPLIPS
jgi:hypothetical protein